MAGDFKPKLNVLGKGNLKVKGSSLAIPPKFTYTPGEAFA